MLNGIGTYIYIYIYIYISLQDLCELIILYYIILYYIISLD